MSGINREQAAAASHRSGHAIVLAGPGTGKTKTLVARHSWLRNVARVNADEIMAVTFTQMAAEELRQRLGPAAPSGAWIGTFHGLCLRLLKRYAEEAGLSKSFKVLDPSAQRAIIASCGIVWNTDDGDLVEMIGGWKEARMNPEQAYADAQRKGNTTRMLAAEHYGTYEEEIARRGDLDFSDLIIRATRLALSGGEAQEFLSARIRHALVDEFQDVNRSQVEFVQALARIGCTIWAVADDDQALYSWRGSDVRYAVAFHDFFPGARRYTLTVNYRCDPAIIAAANAVIASNRYRVAKTLRPAKKHKPGTRVRIWGFETERDEAERISSEIRRFLAAGAKAGDVAILVRTSSVVPSIQQALEAANIPFSLSGSQSFWDLPEVALVADLLTAVEVGALPPSIRLRGARDLVETMKGASPREAGPAAGRLVGERAPGGYSGERASLWTDAAETAASIAASFPTAAAFKAHVASMAGAASSIQSRDGVAVSTIHSSKGLEWRHVFVAGCEATVMPHHKSEDIEEERRLFYVALTRSQGSVDLSFSRRRFGRSQAPSPFLSEASRAPGGAVEWIGGTGRPSSHAASRRPDGSQPPPRPAPTQGTASGGVRTYRRRGGKSLIPPDEE